jgi:neutral amino acid transport system permease protein
VRLRIAALLAAVAGVLVIVAPGTALAATTPAPSPSSSAGAPAANERPTEGSYIGVTLIDSSKATKDSDGEPVPGVDLAVLDATGAEVGTSTTDDAGQVFIPIPGRGDFSVELDKESLPDGVELSGDAGTKKTVTVRLDGGTFVQFQIGVEEVASVPFIEKLSQAAVTGLRNGLIIAVAALGLSMIFGTTGLTNFSHGEIMTFGAFATYVFNVTIGMPVIVAVVAAVIIGGLYGWLNERILWRPLRHRGVGLIAMMIVSIGLSLFLRSVYQFFFGSTYRSYDEFRQQRQTDFGPFSLAPKDLWVMGICVVVLVVVITLLKTTRMGKATRAVSDNQALAASSGLRVDGVISVVWIVGAAITALAGALQGLLYQVNFTLGFNLLLLLFAAVTLGGLGTIWGSLLGSLIIGVLVNVGPVFGVPESIKNAGALAVLILVLLIRPQGILGRKERIG